MSNPEHTPVSADVRNRIVAFLPRLRRFCVAVAGNADAGDDLVQSTVERALVRIDQWQEGTSLESWMFRIARNMHIDAVRSASKRGPPLDIDAAAHVVGEDGLAILEGRSDLAAVQAAFATLPEEQKSLLALVVLNGASYREAADVLGIPMGTVMSRLARARRALDAATNGQAG